MENASKALIIAGAILLAILLISLGIMIFNQAQDTVNNNGMSQAELQSFNNKFIKYEGTNKSGSEVKAMINEIIASNADESNSKRQIQIQIKGPSTFGPAKPNSTSDINVAKKYKVEIIYATKSEADTAANNTSVGAVFKIVITPI